MTPKRKITKQRWQQSNSTNSANGTTSSASSKLKRDFPDVSPVALAFLEDNHRYQNDDDATGYISYCDDDAISPRPFRTGSAFCTRDKKESTREIVEESNMQVSFCEMTAAEMNQILDWWSTPKKIRKAELTGTPNQVESGTGKNDSQKPKVSLVSDLNLPLLDQENDVSIEQALAGNSLMCSTPDSKSSNVIGNNFELGSVKHSLFSGPLFSPSSPCESGMSNGIDGEEALPQDLSFYSSLKEVSKFFLFHDTSDTQETTSSKEDPQINNHSVFAFDLTGKDEVDLNVSFVAREQQENIARLVFDTQDMAERVAFLTETSGTDEADHDGDNASLMRERSSSHAATTLFKLPVITKSLHRRRRRRRQRQNAAQRNRSCEDMAPTTTTCDDSVDAWMQLDWKDHVHLWLFRQFMILETTFVSRCLFPVLPIPMLLFLIQRPKVFRYCLLVFVLFGVVIFVPCLMIMMTLWYCYPTSGRVITDGAPMPNLQLFLQHPYYESEHHYSLQSCLPATIAHPSGALEISEARNIDSLIL